VKSLVVLGKTLAEHGGVQWMLCDNDMDIHGATLVLLVDVASRRGPELPRGDRAGQDNRDRSQRARSRSLYAALWCVGGHQGSAL
jgi:hypothetical protein